MRSFIYVFVLFNIVFASALHAKDESEFIDSEIFTEKENAYLHNKKEIKVCADPDWMPLEKIENGKLIGISSDYINIIESKLDIPMNLVPTKSWSESIEFAKSRKCDIFSLAMQTPERKKYMDFTKPYISIPLVIATTNEKLFIAEIQEVIDKEFLAVKGYAFTELLRIEYPGIKITEVENIDDGLKKIANGSYFGVIGTLTTVGYKLQKKYIGTLKITGRIGSNWDLGFGARNDEPELLSILNKAIIGIDQRTQQAILGRWVSVKFEQGFDYALFWKMLGVILIIAIVILNRFRVIKKLNKKINKQLKIIDRYVLISYADNKGIITDVSDALCNMTGYTREELIGKNHSIFKHPDTDRKVFDDLWRTITSGKSWSGEIKNLRKDATSYWIDTQISPILANNGVIEGYSALRYDITDKKRIEELSLTDQLTQISNRLFLDNSFKLELQRTKRYNTRFSVIILDIDKFKTVNDKHGHDVGDKVLIEMASLFKESIRSTDILGRWGGEEFLIICPVTKLNQAIKLAQKIRSEIENYYFDTVGTLTCSFGVSEHKPTDKNNEVIKRADNALYKAKKANRNSVMYE